MTDLRQRTRDYALAIIRLYPLIPKTAEAQVMARQVLRPGTSPDAQYREACRAKSDKDFISKIEGALQELDETDYWLDLLVLSGNLSESDAAPILNETDELIRIMVTMARNRKAALKS